MRIVPPTSDGIAVAAEAVRAGLVVAYPTETVYGLGVDPFSQDAVRRLFEMKGRDPKKPLLLIGADADQIQAVAEWSAKAAAYARAYWPGPLSLVLPRSPNLPAWATAGLDRVCVRCPACKIARDLCRAVGHAVTSTSANRSGEPPARSLAELDLEGIAVAIDGGTLEPSAPSTILDPESGEILREGAIFRDQLQRFVS